MPVGNAQWEVDIETKCRSYDPVEYGEKKKRRSIYKWPNDLVAASTLSRHCAPTTVSLGPYHHGEPKLQPMKHHKERALLKILHRSKIPLSSFIQSLQDVEQELWDSYDNLDLNLSHLFLRMMLFDGCFLLEILRSLDNPDPLFGSDGMSLAVIRQDMLIFENQIPLLVLEKLLEVEKGNDVNNHTDLHQLVPKPEHFRTAARLHEAGIEFKKGEEGSGLTITFDEKNGVITLPYIEIDDSSPIFYMNLMAFERMHPPLFGDRKVTEYMIHMDKLIDTAEDVSVLCSQGIVSNLLASDEDAAKLFNAFSNGLIVDEGNIEALSKQWQWQCYAASYWNLALASLKHKYFQSPWSVVSLLAALILLVLTIIQTVFSGMQALNGGK